MNTIQLTDQELRDISHMVDAALEDAEQYMKHYAGDCEEEIQENQATLERWRALAVKFDRLYPIKANCNYLTNEGI